MFDVFFFFKHKTAYEMRISDWSSDVCSSDLDRLKQVDRRRRRQHPPARARHLDHVGGVEVAALRLRGLPLLDDHEAISGRGREREVDVAAPRVAPAQHHVARQHRLQTGRIRCVEAHQHHGEVDLAVAGSHPASSSRSRLNATSDHVAWWCLLTESVSWITTKAWTGPRRRVRCPRSEEHTSELQSLMRISYAVFCLKKKNI